MKKRLLRLSSLLLVLCFFAGAFAGCSAFPALSEFFNPSGTQATVTTRPGSDPARPTGEIRMYYDERLELAGSIVSLDNQESADDLLIDVVGEDIEAGSVTLRAVGVGKATQRSVIISFLLILMFGYMITRIFYFDF